jgi:hypothetical protein
MVGFGTAVQRPPMQASVTGQCTPPLGLQLSPVDGPATQTLFTQLPNERQKLRLPSPGAQLLPALTGASGRHVPSVVLEQPSPARLSQLGKGVVLPHSAPTVVGHGLQVPSHWRYRSHGFAELQASPRLAGCAQTPVLVHVMPSGQLTEL